MENSNDNPTIDFDNLNEDDIEFMKLFYRVFEVNEEGKRLLHKLEERCLKVPICPPGAKDGYGYWREGQTEMLRYFRAGIQQYLDYSKAKSEANA